MAFKLYFMVEGGSRHAPNFGATIAEISTSGAALAAGDLAAWNGGRVLPFPNTFSLRPDAYALARPRYPQELFTWLEVARTLEAIVDRARERFGDQRWAVSMPLTLTAGWISK
jgi:hypothetical protein